MQCNHNTLNMSNVDLGLFVLNLSALSWNSKLQSSVMGGRNLVSQQMMHHHNSSIFFENMSKK